MTFKSHSFIVAIFVLAITLSFSSVPAEASIIQGYDTSLATPGVYYGTGNQNAGFTTITADMGSLGTLELGLSAINRYVGPANEVNDNYFVNAGPLTVPGHFDTGTGSSWDFVFSVNTNVFNIANGATTSDYNFNVLITDLNTSKSTQFKPNLIPDNALNGTTGFQNAEALSFAFIGPLMDYDVNAPDTYQITLFADPKNGSVADPSVSIKVSAAAVPEPATFGLAGIALLGLGFIRRRKDNQG